MIINKINKNVLFAIECISIILGGISTFVITILTMRLAKEKQQKKLAKMISFIPVIALFLSVLINNFFGKPGIITAIIFYIVFALATAILIFIQKNLFEINVEQSNIEKISKRKFNFVPAIIIGIALLLVIIFIFTILLFVKSTRIKDTNGIDDYSLQTIMDSDIKNMNVTVSESFAQFNAYGGKSGATMYEEIDFDEIYYSAESFSGIKVLQATRLADEQFKLTIENTVASGNCKIVLVINGEIYSVIELNSTSIVDLDDVQNDSAYVVVAGESANLNIKIVRQSDQSEDGSLSSDNSNT